MERKNLTLDSVELKLADDGRKFSGYASVFNGVDSYGDTILPGAYKATISDRERPIQMRWNHHGPVIGKWVEVREDEKGLYVEGELTPGHSVAEDAYALMKHQAVTGMSIGYRIPPGGMEKDGEKRLLKEIELVEISVVESPADLGAQVGDVKAAITDAESLKDVERLLRDAAGLSRSEAQMLVSRIKTLCQSDSGAKDQSAVIAGIFQQHKIPQS